jgi:hypothetical protein
VSTYQPFPYAVRVTHSQDVRFRNLHVYSDSKASFDNSVFDQSHHAEIRFREVGSLTLSGRDPAPQEPQTSTIVAPGAKVEKLTDGFFNISGATVDSAGQLYFVDAHWQRIYRWSPETHDLDIVRDNPLDPVNLAFDKAGDLMVVSYSGDGTVYTFKPDSPSDQVTLLKAQPAASRPGMTAVIPVDHWRSENDFIQGVPVRKAYQYISPDGTTFIPAGEDFTTGALYYGTKMSDVLRGFGLGKAVFGHPFYVTDESEQKTYSANVSDDGTLTDVKLFAQQGGESVATDAAGNVYIAAGQIFVYKPNGDLIDTINVPKRPIDIMFGGKDGRTLFILARTALYSVQIKAQ